MFGKLDPTLLIPLGLALTIVLLLVVIGGAMLNAPAGRRYKRRLRGVMARKQGIVAASAAETRSLSRRERSSAMDRLVKRWLPHRELLVRRLEKTGRSITLGQYVLVAIGVTLAVAPVAVLGGLLIGLAAGIALPHIIVGRMGNKRVARFIGLFPEAIDLMVRALRSGLPISE